MQIFYKVIIFTIVLNFSTYLMATENSDSKLEQAIGKLAIFQHKELFYLNGKSTALSHVKINDFMQKQYAKEVSAMKVNDRVDYLWTAIWMTKPQGGELHRIAEIIVQTCCYDKFVGRLSAYIESETSVKRNKRKLKYAKSLKHSLVIIKKHTSSK